MCLCERGRENRERVCFGRLEVNERHRESVELKAIYINAKVAPRGGREGGGSSHQISAVDVMKRESDGAAGAIQSNKAASRRTKKGAAGAAGESDQVRLI